MKVEEWLSSSRDYQKGIDILERAEINSAVLRMLKKGESFYNRKRMAEEIEQISNYSSKPIPSQPAQRQESKPKESKLIDQWDSEIPSTRIPESLAKVVQALRDNYGVVNHYHPLLDATYNLNRKKAFGIKIALQDAWSEIELCWRIINYFKAHGEVLPSKYTKASMALESLDPTDLVKRRNNLRTYISKHRDNPQKAVKVGEWEKELQRIEALIPD